MGIDPNIKAWMEFRVFQHFAQRPELQFEVLDGGDLHYPHAFDVIFALGVLYHTTDPIGMLRTFWKSMKKKGTNARPERKHCRPIHMQTMLAHSHNAHRAQAN